MISYIVNKTLFLRDNKTVPKILGGQLKWITTKTITTKTIIITAITIATKTQTTITTIIILAKTHSQTEAQIATKKRKGTSKKRFLFG